MWLDATKEENWTSKFEFTSYPQVLVLNPGKRKRFAILEEEVSYTNIGNAIIIEIMFEKILNGDARFKMLAQVPELV